MYTKIGILMDLWFSNHVVAAVWSAISFVGECHGVAHTRTHSVTRHFCHDTVLTLALPLPSFQGPSRVESLTGVCAVYVSE